MDIRVISEETNLYYCQSRYYSSAIGRWISADAIEYLDPTTTMGMNLYAYYLNNPVMYTDGTGTSSWSDFWNSTWGKVVGTVLVGGAISGAVFGAGFSIASQGIANGYSNVDWGKVGIDTLIGAGIGALMGAAFAAGGRVLGMLGKTGWAQRSVDFGKSNNFLFGSKSGNFAFLRHGTKFRIEASIQHGIHMHYQTIKNGIIIVGSSVPRTMLINTIWNSIVGITSSSIRQFA